MTEQLAHAESGSGDPLVFLHGITANRRHWEPVVDLLADRFRCVNVDLLGHGDSPRGTSSDLFTQVDAVSDLLDHLGLHDAVLVGHSFGGFIATFCATSRPLRGVVNVDQPFDTAAFREVLEPLGARLRSDDFAAAWDEFVEWERIDLVPPERQALTRDNIVPRQEVVLEVWSTVLDTPPEVLLGQVEAALPAVSAPYLGIFGAELSDTERRLQALIPDSTVEEWAGMGHFVQLVDPERTAVRIAAFVDGLGPAPVR